MVGIILHEGGSPVEIGANDFHGANQGGRLPVAFAGESITVGQQSLNGKAGKLLQTVQILKVRRKALEIALLEEGTQAELDASSVAQRIMPRSVLAQRGCY